MRKTRKNSLEKRKKIKEQIRMVKLILGIPTTGKDRRGFEAEDKVERELIYFRKKKLINSFQRTGRFSSDDLEGKDFIIKLLNGDIVKIDVKNYYNQEDEILARERGVRLLTIRPLDNEKIVREKVLELIISSYLSPLPIEKVRAIVSGAINRTPEKLRTLFSFGKIVICLRK